MRCPTQSSVSRAPFNPRLKGQWSLTQIYRRQSTSRTGNRRCHSPCRFPELKTPSQKKRTLGVGEACHPHLLSGGRVVLGLDHVKVDVFERRSLSDLPMNTANLSRRRSWTNIDNHIADAAEEVVLVEVPGLHQRWWLSRHTVVSVVFKSAFTIARFHPCIPKENESTGRI